MFRCSICSNDFPTKSRLILHTRLKDSCKNRIIRNNLMDDKQDEKNEKLTVLDLFCGCGGMSKGMTDAGLDILLGIDIWDKAIESYNKNMLHEGVCADLTKLSPTECDEKYIKGRRVDIIIGGPPCQSFSIAGKRDKSDPRNTLFMEYVRYLDYYKPKAFLMENVIGMLSKRTESNDNVIDLIMRELNHEYNCFINKLTASDFEVPQNRRRVIIIGIRKNLNIIPTHIPTVIKTIDDRISVGNILLSREVIEPSYFLSEKAIQGIINKKEKSRQKGAGFGAQFLDLNKPSYTIPARYWKDGYDALVSYSDTDIRRLTVLELKRVQTFPDNYYLAGNKKDMIMQIGNAVPCRFAYHLAKYIIDTLQ